MGVPIASSILPYRCYLSSSPQSSILSPGTFPGAFGGMGLYKLIAANDFAHVLRTLISLAGTAHRD
jgi:hypothetical protein